MERWSNAEGYEQFVGRWSREVAKKFLGWLAEPRGDTGWRAPDPAGCWLDVGSGTGVLAQLIHKQSAGSQVAALDRTLAYISLGRRIVVSGHQGADGYLGWVTADAQNIPLSSATFDAVVSGLVLNFVPSPALAVSEMKRVARPGGVVAVYVWDYAGKMEMMRYFWDAATELYPDAGTLDEGWRFTLSNPKSLREAFTQSGLQAVETRGIEIETTFRDFNDYWTPFLSGQGPAPGYTMSLSEENRSALRERLRRGLPAAKDGSIHLAAQAWAVRGLVPGPG